MKQVSLAFVSVLLPLILSCRATTSPNVETANVIGRAELYGHNNWLLSSKGISVTLENTRYSALTNDSGFFELKNVPEGTYNIRFSKAGFGDIYWYGKSIQGGGNASIYWTERVPDNYNSGSVFLTQRPALVTTLQQGGMFDDRVLKLTGSYAGNDTNSIAIFFSHHSNVSSTPGMYETYAVTYLNSGVPSFPNVRFDRYSNTFEAVMGVNDIPYLWDDFDSGDSVYVACYACPKVFAGKNSGMPSGDYFRCDYYDPVHHVNVLSSIDQTPSPVFGLKIP